MLNWTNLNKHRQGWSLDEGWNYRGRGLHIQIHHDTSYPNQSTATCSVWNPDTLTWNRIASVMYQEWAAARDQVDPIDNCHGGTVGMWEAYEELQARSVAILDLN